MKFFLNAKSWQMFLLLVGSMFGAQMLVPVFGDPTVGILVITLAFMAVYMAWLLSIAVKANQKLEEPLKKSPRWMVLGLAYAASHFDWRSRLAAGFVGTVPRPSRIYRSIASAGNVRDFLRTAIHGKKPGNARTKQSVDFF